MTTGITKPTGTMRATSVVAGFAAALGLFWLGSIFALNGQQWAWWRWSAYASAGFVLIAAVLHSKLPFAPGWRGNRATALAGAVTGGVIVAVAITVMAHAYSDPYSGDLFWPHALALLALAGSLLLVTSAFILSRP